MECFTTTVGPQAAGTIRSTPEGRQSGEGWLHIDDEVVSVVQHEDVFGNYDNERVDERCVYMLVYCLTAPQT